MASCRIRDLYRCECSAADVEKEQFGIAIGVAGTDACRYKSYDISVVGDRWFAIVVGKKRNVVR